MTRIFVAHLLLNNFKICPHPVSVAFRWRCDWRAHLHMARNMAKHNSTRAAMPPLVFFAKRASSLHLKGSVPERATLYPRSKLFAVFSSTVAFLGSCLMSSHPNQAIFKFPILLKPPRNPPAPSHRQLRLAHFRTTVMFETSQSFKIAVSESSAPSSFPICAPLCPETYRNFGKRCLV